MPTIFCDRISYAAAIAIRQTGGRVMATTQGRCLFTPPKGCAWEGPTHLQRMALPDSTILLRFVNKTSVKLLLIHEYLAHSDKLGTLR